MAFAGFLRVGEFTYREADRQLGSSFGKWYITKRSLKVSNNATHMELTLPASKTDPFRKGITLAIASTQDPRCPVEAMRQLLHTDSHRPHSAPLFCIGEHDQRAFTREYVVTQLQHLAQMAGLGQGTWNGHSFRRGAATWATQAGMSEGEIQTLGRWRSDAYKSYIEYSNDKRIALSQRFQLNRARDVAR